jgi:hydrogenase maturation protein HypF
MLTLEQPVAMRVRIRGLVQGVGFRPAVHRLATTLKLHGWVCNDGAGLLIHLEGGKTALEAFTRRLPAAIPPTACIEAMSDVAAVWTDVAGFGIRVEANASDEPLFARIPPDHALCADCRADILDPTNRRYHHPFATCTNCGPRYSIMQEMPYERQHTGMQSFSLCRQCKAEYEDAEDRRFHAEPIACPACGPRLKSRATAVTASAVDWKAIVVAAAALRSGQVVAMKGLGGYQLLVRADNEDAVIRLRTRKHRPSKPFAVMVRSIEEAERIARISPSERDLLLSAENPIVVLPSRNTLANAVAPGLNQIGVLLPTMPLHTLLLSQFDFPVVVTSGNQSNEPIAIDEAESVSLGPIVDVFLEHDRPIVRRLDDSVIRVIDERPAIIRLARGYAPCCLPALERWAASSEAPIPPILALGGQQKTALALWTGTQAILAQHLGDMDHPEARCVFASTTDELARLYRCEPKILAGDLHPDYFTTRFAQSSRLSFIQVQHHHAHAVACMVEHGLLGQDVLGVIFDGTGFGADGTIWGGEILHVSMSRFQRVGSLELFTLPGGEAAIHEPNRIALSLLANTFGSAAIPRWLLGRLGISDARAQVLLAMIDRCINAPPTSSVGRLFDAVAALLLEFREVTFEGEAALLLENAADLREEAAYPIGVRVDESGMKRGDWRPLIRRLVDDISHSTAIGVCAARFHNALARWSAVIAAASPCEDVVLGGGCFQNGYLMHRTRIALKELGKNVHVPSRIPANDGGLAVGQLAVAMAHRRRQPTEKSSCVSAFPAALLNGVS